MFGERGRTREQWEDKLKEPEQEKWSLNKMNENKWMETFWLFQNRKSYF